jgi:hypothetical protein
LNSDHTLEFPQLLDCPSGALDYCFKTHTLHWSDEMYRIHGYERGEVVPTFELALSHVNPAERKRAVELWSVLQNGGGRYTNYHTITDARGKEHRVLTVAEVRTVDGVIQSARGIVTDLTGVLDHETRAVANVAVVRSHEHRAAIEQAKGMLMGWFKTDGDTAFRILTRLSSTTNYKLNQLAEGFVAHAMANGVQQTVEAFFGPGSEHLMELQDSQAVS